MSNRTRNALPWWYACRRYVVCTRKRALKAVSRATMRARERAALDALRHGADPETAAWPANSREVVDRWAYD